jgi:hypothetical protein
MYESPGPPGRYARAGRPLAPEAGARRIASRGAAHGLVCVYG